MVTQEPRIDVELVRHHIATGRGGMWVAFLPTAEELLAQHIRLQQKLAIEYKLREEPPSHVGEDPIGTRFGEESTWLRKDTQGRIADPWMRGATTVMPDAWFANEHAEKRPPRTERDEYTPEHFAHDIAAGMRGHALRDEAHAFVDRWIPGTLKSPLDRQLAHDIVHEIMHPCQWRGLVEDMGWTWRQAATATREAGVWIGGATKETNAHASRPESWPQWEGEEPEDPDAVHWRCVRAYYETPQVDTIRYR